MYSAEIDDFFGIPPPSAPPSYEETIGGFSPSSRVPCPPPIPPRAAEITKKSPDLRGVTDLNDNCNNAVPTIHHPPLIRIPTITVTSAPSTPEVLDNEVDHLMGHVTSHVINVDDHVTQINQANDNANNSFDSSEDEMDPGDLDPDVDVREPGDGEDGDEMEGQTDTQVTSHTDRQTVKPDRQTALGSDQTTTKVQLDPSVIVSLEKRVSWSGEYIEGQERVRASHGLAADGQFYF